MKLTREQIVEQFGSAPETPKGKKLVGVGFQTLKDGDCFWTGHGWLFIEHPYCKTKAPVAIFEDTHRLDGTPFELDPLPEIDGYRVEFFGKNMKPSDMGDACGYACWVKSGMRWECFTNGLYPTGEDNHYARLFKVAEPTTHSEMFEGGSCWICELHHENHWLVTGVSDGYLHNGSDLWSFKDLRGFECRWSNSPCTPYEEANDFVI